jgi:hypothetical protein
MAGPAGGSLTRLQEIGQELITMQQLQQITQHSRQYELNAQTKEYPTNDITKYVGTDRWSAAQFGHTIEDAYYRLDHIKNLLSHAQTKGWQASKNYPTIHHFTEPALRELDEMLQHAVTNRDGYTDELQRRINQQRKSICSKHGRRYGLC